VIPIAQSLPRAEHPPQAVASPAADQISVELATTRKEKEKVYRFRYQVYVEEMGKILSSADHRRRLVIDAEDAADRCLLFYARIGNEVIGTMRLHIGRANDFLPYLRDNMALDRFESFPARIPENLISYTSKSMVDPRYRRSQAFYLLSANVYETFRRHECPFNFTVGAPYMVALYEQLGHRRYMGNFSVPGYGYMAPMVLLTEDVDHLRKVRSPLWRVARKFDNSPAAAEWFAREFPDAARFVNRQMIGKEDIWRMLADKLGRPLERAVPLFRGMSEAEAMTCADAGHIILCEAGDAIVDPLDMCNDVFVIMSGVVSVRRQAPDRRPSVSISGPAKVYGEKAFVAHSRQNATVIAQTGTEILVFPRHSIERLELQHPEVAAKLLHNIGFRRARKYA
jgi:hypothetical protein